MSVKSRVFRTSGGNLHCPLCKEREQIRKIEEVNFYIYRYQCGKCGQTFRYDRTPVRDFNHKGGAYHSFTRGLRLPVLFRNQKKTLNFKRDFEAEKLMLDKK